MAAKVLSSRTELGGAVGDMLTGNKKIITRVIKDGVYIWDPYNVPLSTDPDITKETNQAPTKAALAQILDKANVNKWFDDVTSIAARDAIADVNIGDRVKVVGTAGTDGKIPWTVYVARGSSPSPNWQVETDSDNLTDPLPLMTIADVTAGTAKGGYLVSPETMKALLLGTVVATVADLPDPTTVSAGTRVSVVNDANDPRVYMAFGVPGQSGQGWI